MIEAVYSIGKITNKREFLEEFIDNIGDNYKNVFKIKLDVSDKNNPCYKGLAYEEFDSEKKMQYFYKRGSSKGLDKTPTSKITEIEKTFKNKIKNFFSEYSRINKNQLTEDDKKLLSNIQNLINEKYEIILSDFINFAKTGGFIKNNKLNDPGIVMFVFYDGVEWKYPGEMTLFISAFKNNENEAYRNFYYKSGIKSTAKDKFCYICGNPSVAEVWGFVNTYNFYTADKESYVAGGFDQKLMWKNYPVCPDCAKTLERGKEYVDNNLVFKFCNFNYYIIPELIIQNDKLLDQILGKMKKYQNFSLQEKEASLIERTEEKILKELSQESNNINFNFLFFEKSNAAFKILLFLQEIAPTRLKFLIEAKEKVDKENYKYNIFEEIKTKNKTIKFDFSFSAISEFFPNNKLDGNFNKYFLSILNDIFIGKKIFIDFLLKRFMEKVRSEFLKENWIEPLVLKSYKILLYLNEIKILERRVSMTSVYSDNFKDFFEKHSIFDDDLKKALFLEGVLARKLLNIQYQEKNSTPFASRLNGLKIDEKVAKRLLPEIINKLEEYDKNYYTKLESAISEYLLNAVFGRYSIDELSYYFTLGYTLEKHFDFKNETKEHDN